MHCMSYFGVVQNDDRIISGSRGGVLIWTFILVVFSFRVGIGGLDHVEKLFLECQAIQVKINMRLLAKHFGS